MPRWTILTENISRPTVCRPRMCVGVTGLAYEALIEIDLVARRP